MCLAYAIHTQHLRWLLLLGNRNHGDVSCYYALLEAFIADAAILTPMSDRQTESTHTDSKELYHTIL